MLAAENLVWKVHNGRNPNVDTTAETKNLIMKDVYIIPEVPVVIVSPASEERKKKAMREQAALQELQKGR